MATTISPIWRKFFNYTVTSAELCRYKKNPDFDYIKIVDKSEMVDKYHIEVDRDKRWYAERYIGPRIVYWVMMVLQTRYWKTTVVKITDKLYRFTYFTYLRESDGKLVSQSRNYEIRDKLSCDYFWQGNWIDFKAVQIIAVSWLRANMAARRIQRLWRKRRAAVQVIKKAWKEAISNPSYTLCKKRLLREANELTI
jgi:hypothetical protein